MAYAKFEDSGYGYYWLASTGDPAFVSALKAKVPAHLRSYDPGTRRWMLDPSAVATVAQLATAHLGVTPALPPVALAGQVASTRFYRVVYVGSPKYREDGSYTATAYCENEQGVGEWKLVIPVGVLRDHFEGVLKDLFAETGAEDEWSLIGLDRDKASSYTEADIKRAVRLAMARAHPDVNKDPDAHERFLKVQDAGEVLATPRGRHFSIMGAQQADAARRKRLQEITSGNSKQYNYHPPRRSGWIMVEGADLLGGKQVLVSKIIDFVDITDDDGRVLNAFIPKGQRTPVPTWITI